MTFALTPYQETAVADVLAELRDAADVFARRAKKTAVGLSAPTGAGKTVMATAVLERLIHGDDTAGPNPDQTVLWVTDAPALNRQTAEKMLVASARFTLDDIVFLDSGFDAKRLTPGKVHFVHIQQLSKGATSFQSVTADGRRRDQREFGFWDTIANTVTDHGRDFLLVVDEAHRGTEGAGRDAATIVSTLIHGGPNQVTGAPHPAAPLVLGISATPEKFRKSMDREGRSLEDVTVPVAEVRESGLLKDRIVVRHPGENQPSHETLVGLAVRALDASDAAWRAHHEAALTDGTATKRVEPLLVIQVSPGTKPADLAPLLDVLAEENPDLVGDAVAHAFQEHTALNVPGDRTVRYVAPDRIADDPRARVVFFKNALTTGWDCPRAEVMLSLRSADDCTSIAQLIGRMVRTPLAERVEDSRLDEQTLNSVALFLPHYNRDQVAKVIAALDSETGGDTEVEVEPVDCLPRGDIPDKVWDLLASLPSAARTKKAFPTSTHRLLALARLLRGHDLLVDANAQAKARLVGAVTTEAAVLAADIKKAVADVVTLDMTGTVWDARAGVFVTDEPGDLDAVVTARTGDVTAQYKAAVRILPDAVAKWYWDALCDADPDLDPYEARARVAALVKTPELAAAVKGAVEKAAADQVQAWRAAYANKVSMLGQEARLDFESVWSPRTGTMTVDLVVPEKVSAATQKVTGTGENAVIDDVPTHAHHLFVAPDDQDKVEAGKFPATLTGWEVDVLARETDTGTLVGWYRNPPRSKHGLAVAYESDGEVGLLYPDFLFFHDVDGTVVVDVVDPHGHHASDTGPKWAGLARWAAENRTVVRRVVAVIKVGADLLALDLTRDGIGDRLGAAGSQAAVEALFASDGGAY